MAKIRVMVIDDSTAIRGLLKSIIQEDPELEWVAEAADPYEARELIKFYNPDVLTLDVEMPKMDGLTFLRNLMRLRPMPVIMLSTLTTEGADVAMKALEIGAIDCLAKPRMSHPSFLERFTLELNSKLKVAASSKRHVLRNKKLAETALYRWECPEQLQNTQLLAIGASTGGTEAIKDVLMALPESSPPIVITQHIPAIFSARFANRLDKCCRIRVHEAKNNQLVEPGNAYIAPGDFHLRIERQGGKLWCRVVQSEPVNLHRPSVDVMFQSLLALDVTRISAMLLTGMGRDGAEGLLELRKKGAFTLAQDEGSSMVWGMPGAAVKIGAATRVVSLEEMAKAVVSHWQGIKAG
ncbi:protein-glutamate methylesterase/protein-glutamine glutaminase [Pokkaliibacter sp. CJK22405]|uniref:protein-glutamate methylesterase/protein-glutamine glutaminase n=1 Tax=Pokkaliibacter sp. CJK22405 TaxID=3384615 RepID=UPI0039856B0D